MTVGLLLITHQNFGDVALHTIKTIIGVCPLDTKSLSVPFDANPDEIYQEAVRHIEILDKGEGVLVLTDLFGATPSNIAHRLPETHHVTIVTGLNLSMLMRVVSYPNLSLAELAHKAMSGGQEGVFISSFFD